ncbi:uncharacterized protein LOC121684362 isoform X2 [Alosa sapidissima]|uniref:uncharacterized protein LOC121684362 isoform X2 n=1 Tax=Alosa sapidissima TaxID=34773 RepID=UPI001C07F65D|nr:uncharacterized protein LOC121684362 isoform X2 [Alosa sapidissima]
MSVWVQKPLQEETLLLYRRRKMALKGALTPLHQPRRVMSVWVKQRPSQEEILLLDSKTQTQIPCPAGGIRHTVQEDRKDGEGLCLRTQVFSRWTPEEAKIHEKLRSTLKSKFPQLVEGVPNQGDPRLLQDIYTDLYVTKGGGGGVSYEHEVRQIEVASWRGEAKDTPIKCSDIFKPIPKSQDDRRGVLHLLIKGEAAEDGPISSINPLSGQHKPIRTVLTKGVAGIAEVYSGLG